MFCQKLVRNCENLLNKCKFKTCKKGLLVVSFGFFAFCASLQTELSWLSINFVFCKDNAINVIIFHN